MRHLLFISLFLFTACSSSKQNLKEITSPIQRDSSAYIINGVGNSEKEAIAEALERIASTLSSEVSSVFIIRKKSTNLEYIKTVQHNIKVEVKKMSFVYDILSSSVKKNRYFVKIKIDRQKSAMRYVNRLKRTLSRIDNELQALSSLKRYLFLKQYPVDKLYYTVDIVSMIDPTNQKISLFEQKIKKLEKKRYQHQKELSFSVSSSDAYLRDIVIDLLSDAKFNISSDAEIKLSVNLGNIEIDEIYGEYHADGSAVIKMVKNKEIISKIIPLSATPSSDKKGARDNIIKAFQKEFPKFIEKEFR